MNASSFNLEAFRVQFPFLSEDTAEKFSVPVVYLDNAATTQKPLVVLQAQQAHLMHCNANVHRGAYPLAVRATQAYESARAVVADFVGAKAQDIVFTRGTTEAINLVVQSLASSGFLKTGDGILLMEQSHHAQLVPWLMLAERLDLCVEYIGVLVDGSLDLSNIEAQLARAKVCALTHVSNVLGLENDVAVLCQKAQSQKTLTVVDGAQAVLHTRIDVQAIGCDFYAFSGHKMFAPDGIGALYIQPNIVDNLAPFQGGGDMVAQVSLHKKELVFKSSPYKFEAGTPNISGAVALAKAVVFVQRYQTDAAKQHLATLSADAISGLIRLTEVPIRLLNAGQNGIVSFVIEGLDAFDVAHIMGEYGVCVRAGKHCAEPLLTALGVSTCLRASFALYNTQDDIIQFIKALQKAIELLRE